MGLEMANCKPDPSNQLLLVENLQIELDFYNVVFQETGKLCRYSAITTKPFRKAQLGIFRDPARK